MWKYWMISNRHSILCSTVAAIVLVPSIVSAGSVVPPVPGSAAPPPRPIPPRCVEPDNKKVVPPRKKEKPISADEKARAEKALAAEKAQARSALMKMGKAVDNMAADVEQFGTVNMSSPLLTMPTRKLGFDLDISAKAFYINAKKEVMGRALSATAIARSLGVDVQGAADLGQVKSAEVSAKQLEIDEQRYEALVASRTKRAENAYNEGLVKVEAATTTEDKAKARTAAENARDTILREDLSSFKPKTGEASSSPDLPGSAAGQAAGNGAPRVSSDLTSKVNLDAFSGVGDDAKKVFAGELALPDLDAVKAAESAASLQGLSRFFHQPTEVMQFQGKIVMMGAVTVSVMPGWRTRKDFAAEVVMVNQYTYVPARREVVERMTRDLNLPEKLRERLAYDYQLLPRALNGDGQEWINRGPVTIPEYLKYKEKEPTGMRPLVSGISPMSQSDTLDLASVFKRQDETAIALAATLKATGWNAQSKIFNQFVKNQKKDVQTRSSSATVATYSRAGGVVGFQIGPRLKALADPASRSNKSAFILERQAFPALLVYGLDAADIYPRIECRGGRLFVHEANIKNTQRSYWQPMTHRFQGPNDWFSLKLLWRPVWWESRLNRDRLVRRALDLHDSMWDAVEVLPGNSENDDRQGNIRKWAREIQESGNEMKERYIGAFNTQYLPPDVSVPLGLVPSPDGRGANGFPQVERVQPEVVTVTLPAAKPGEAPPVAEPFEVIFAGQGLDAVRQIQCRFPPEVLEFAQIGEQRKDRLITIARESSIIMHVRVKKSVALYFNLLVDPAAYGLAAGGTVPILKTPAISVVVNGQPPGQVMVAPILPGSLASGEAPQSILTEPAQASPLIVNSAPLDLSDPLQTLDPALALFPNALPVPAAPSRLRR